MFGFHVIAIITRGPIVAEELYHRIGRPGRWWEFDDTFRIEPAKVGSVLLGVLVSIAVPGVEPEIHRVLIGRANRRAAHDDISADIAFDASNAPAVKVQFDGRAKNGASRGG